MGYKKICLECRLSLTRAFDDGTEDRRYPCPECGKEMILMPHRFRPPKKSDEKKWQTVEFFIQHGFYYQHIQDGPETRNHINRKEKYVEYPETVKEAKEFVIKYREQAIKK